MTEEQCPATVMAEFGDLQQSSFNFVRHCSCGPPSLRSVFLAVRDSWHKPPH